MKRREKYFLLFLLLPVLSFCQFQSSIDFIGSLDYTQEADEFIDFRNTISFGSNANEPKYNYRIGVNINGRAQDNVYFKSGIRFVEMGFLNCVKGYIPDSLGFGFDPSMVQFFNTSYYLRFIEIPFALRYQIGQGRVSFFMEGGISSHFYLNSKQVVVSNDYVDSSTLREKTKRIHYAILFSAGLNYNFSNTHQLFVQPILRSFRKQSDFRNSSTPLSIGFELGLRYALAK